MTMTQKSTTKHPGIILLEQFMVPHQLSQRRLAEKLKIPFYDLNSILYGHSPITKSLALKLAHCFGVSAQFWLDLQANFDESEKDANPKI